MELPDHCLICCEAFDEDKHRPGVGACEHLGTCSLCFQRLRLLVRDLTCCVCKTSLDNVYIFSGPREVRPFASLQFWGDNAGPGTTYDEGARMYMPLEYYKDVFVAMQQPLCGMKGCSAKGKSVRALRDHLREKHERFLCEVCLENKKVFLGEQTRYTKGQLDRHLTKGEPDKGFDGHPLCKFCRKRQYDATALYEHLNRQHYSCDICERRGIKYKYYRDYPMLEEHFRDAHYLCEDPRCLEQKFVVFANQMDLQGHMVHRHPEQGASRRVVASFRVRGAKSQGGGARESKDGEEEEAPGEWEAGPPPPQSQVRAGRAGSTGGGGGGGRAAPPSFDAEAFPDLSQEASARAQASAPRWSASSGEGGPKEDFPTLASSVARASTAATASASLRRVVAPAPPPAPPSRRLPGDKGQEPVLERNKRLAEALGLAGKKERDAQNILSHAGPASSSRPELTAYQVEMLKPTYPRELLVWAGQNRAEVSKLEGRFEAFLKDDGATFLNLRPMPPEQRKRVHLLAEVYKLKTSSYDYEPKRYICVTKGLDSQVPIQTLSEAAADYLHDLKLRGPQAPRGHPPSVVLSNMPATIGPQELVDMVQHLAGPSHLITGVHPVVLGPAGTRLLLVEFLSPHAVPTVLDNHRKYISNMPFTVKDGLKSGEAERIYAAVAAQHQARNAPPTAPRQPVAPSPLPPPPPEPPSTGGDSWDDDDITPTTAKPPPKDEAKVQSQRQGESDQLSSSGPRWGQSVLKGKLQPRTRPIEEEKKELPAKVEKEPRKKKEGGKKPPQPSSAAPKGESAFGVPREANPWDDLVSDDEDGP